MLTIKKKIAPVDVLGDSCEALTVQVQEVIPNEKAYIQVVLLPAEGANPSLNKRIIMEDTDYTERSIDDMCYLNFAVAYLAGVGIEVEVIEPED